MKELYTKIITKEIPIPFGCIISMNSYFIGLKKELRLLFINLYKTFYKKTNDEEYDKELKLPRSIWNVFHILWDSNNKSSKKCIVSSGEGTW